jgi:hypothetical protein
LSGVTSQAAASKNSPPQEKAVGVVPALVDPGDKAHRRVVAVRPRFVQPVRDLLDRIPGGGAVGGIEDGVVDSRSFQHPPVVVEGAGVGVVGQGIGFAVVGRLGAGKGEVVLEQGVAAREGGQILEDAVGGALGDDEAVEEVDIGADATADRGHQLGGVGHLGRRDLDQLSRNRRRLAVVGLDDPLHDGQVGVGHRRPEDDRLALGAGRDDGPGAGDGGGAEAGGAPEDVTPAGAAAGDAVGGSWEGVAAKAHR